MGVTVTVESKLSGLVWIVKWSAGVGKGWGSAVDTGGVDVQVRVIRYDSTVGLVFFIFRGMEKLKGKGTERPGKDNRRT